MSNKEQLFPSIGSVATQTHDQQSNEDNASGDNEERAVQEIESLCMTCGKQGVTRLLLTSIPYFREVIVMSFRCEHCGTQNNEVQMAGQIRPEGTMYTARILARSDLDRQVVKSETSTVIIPEYELTIPPSKGQLTTVEGIIRDIVRDLSYAQPLRRIQDEPTYTKIQSLIDKLRLILADDVDEEAEENKNEIGEVKTASASQSDKPMPAFTIKIDDPAGNSFIEFNESMADPKWNLRTYHRTREQNVALGLVAAEEQADTTETVESESQGAQSKVVEAGAEFAVGPDGRSEEIFEFPGVCSSCGHSLTTRMKKVNIPHFKDVIIMSTNCERCGYRDNEIKSGSAISEKGTRITLKVEDAEDLSRDLLKSETAGLIVPEIDLILQPGTLGGRFTTLEGILDQIYEELSEKAFVTGDSGTTGAFESFLAKLKLIKNVEGPFTLILDDPLSNSHLQNPYAPDPDPNMTIETYERTFEQNEELGLNDMKVEGYEVEIQEAQP